MICDHIDHIQIQLLHGLILHVPINSLLMYVMYSH